MRKRIISVALALCLCISSTSMAYASQGDPMRQEDALTEQSASKLAARDSTIPTPTEAYEAMIALKDQDKYKGLHGPMTSLIPIQKDIITGRAEPLTVRISAPWDAWPLPLY